MNPFGRLSAHPGLIVSTPTQIDELPSLCLEGSDSRVERGITQYRYGIICAADSYEGSGRGY